MIIYKDEQYNFFEIFNEHNGMLIRSDVNGVDPEMRSFPELLDVGIMGYCESFQYCKKAGIDCYQRGGSVNSSHMSIQDFELIARQASGKTFQIALGGAGDPNKHPFFEDILRICKYYRIVPNLTTSGVLLTDEEIRMIKQYCGAVAVSWYSRLDKGKETNLKTINAINRFIENKCLTNVHYVVSTDTIDEAIDRLDNDLFPQNVNAVVFILYKPVGFGIKEKKLLSDDNRLEMFFKAINKKHPFLIGFDTCFTPAILRWGTNIAKESIDVCEAATFSMYIDSQMNCHPCSFGIWDDGISESLHQKTIREVWNGEQFTNFRKKVREKCSHCDKNEVCRAGCKLDLAIDLCE